MATNQEISKRSNFQTWRRLSIKRLQMNGVYEDNWLDISGYVVEGGWPTVKSSYGDQVFLGAYQIDNVDITLNNINRKFNRYDDIQSLFNGYLTRYRTKVKVEAGYVDDDGTELTGIVWYGFFSQEPVNTQSGQVKISVAPLLKCLDMYTVTVDGVNYNQTDGKITYGGQGTGTGIQIALPWQANFAYVVGNKVVQTTSPNSSYCWQCTTAGTSGGSEPGWPCSATVGDTTQSDGGVTWTAVATPTTTDVVSSIVKLKTKNIDVFDNFFDGNTEAEKYKINPFKRPVTSIANPFSNIKDSTKCFDKIKDYSLFDDFFPYVDKNGAFVWDSKSENYPAWEPNHYYLSSVVVKDRIRTSSNSQTYYWECTSTGSSGATEPAWPENPTPDVTTVYEVNEYTVLIWTYRSATPTFQLNGGGSFDNDWGINIIELTEERINVDAFWSRISVGYGSASLNALAYNIWTPGDGSLMDIYGDRAWSESYSELNQDQAQAIANKLLMNNGIIRMEWDVKTKFMPDIFLKDKGILNFKGTIPNVASTDMILDQGVFNTNTWGGSRNGSINIDNVIVKVIAFECDLNTFISSFTLREV